MMLVSRRSTKGKQIKTAGVVSLIVGMMGLAYSVVWAATSPWTQTDWSGGDSSSLVTGEVATWKSLDGVEATASAGLLKLKLSDGWASEYQAWSSRRKITFDNTTATLGVTSEELTDFPVLVKLDSGVDIDYTKTQDSGQDIRFVDEDGSSLDYEIETWDESGSSYVWVRVPQIDVDSSTDYIYMYYGNSAVSDGQDSGNTWSSDFTMTYHFDEDLGTSGTGSVIDSTSNTGGTPASGTVFGQSGKIGRGVNLSSSNGGVALGSQNAPLLTADTTISFWLDVSNISSPSRQNPFGQAYGGWGTMTLESNGAISWFFGSSGRNASPYGSHQSPSGTITNGNWILITAVRDDTSSTYTWYKNGAYLSGSGYSSSYPVISSQPFNIGDDYVNHINGLIDEFRVQSKTRAAGWVKADYNSQVDAMNTISLEESNYPSTGSLTSSTFDAGFSADWGVMEYTASSSGVTVKVRTDNSEDMSGADAWAACTGIASGTDLTESDCVSDQDRYLEYQVILESSEGLSPEFYDISFDFTASDQVRPTVNASSVLVTGIENKAWIGREPVITWTAGEDDPAGNGLEGYCISLDEQSVDATPSALLNPETSSGVLMGIDDGVDNGSTCPYIVAGTSVDLSTITGLDLVANKQYWFSIKAVDLAGNVAGDGAGVWQDLVSFKYDNVVPSSPSYFSLPGDFIATKSATLTWPTTGGGASDSGGSGLAGLQYRIGVSGTWFGDTHSGAEDATDLLDNDGSYSTVQFPDFENITEGSTFIYMRALDYAGNVSSSYISGTLKINTTSPSSPQNLVVDPLSSETNSYSFTWDDPGTYTGEASNLAFCYTVNTLPSEITCAFTEAGVNTLPADAFATQPGVNTMYLVARDEAGNINYDTYASVEFTYSGSAPGMPLNIDVADVSVKATSSWKLAVSWEEPSDVGAGVSSYKVYHSTDGVSYSLESTVAGISYVDTSLSQEVHYYKAKACDSANNCGAFTSPISLYPDGKFTTAPELSSDPVVSSVTTKQATISWSTDRTADSKIQYGTSSGSYFDEEPSKSAHETSHLIVLTSLEPGTTYYYKAKWTDEDGNTGISDEFSFSTDPAPVAKEVSAENVSLDTATVQFTTSNATKAVIYYGETTSFGGVKEVSTSMSETTYTVQLVGLLDGTKYYYKINLLDSEEEEYAGDINSFTTLPRPKISVVRLQQVKGTASSTVLVTWASNTEISSIISYYPSSAPGSVLDQIDVRQKTAHRLILRGLLPHTPYTLVVKGRDKMGNEAVSNPQVFTTASDTRPPLMSNLKVDPVIQGAGEEAVAQLVVSWDTDELSSSQVTYGEGSSGSFSSKTQKNEQLTFNHLVVIPNLQPSKVYHLKALSTDDANNEAESIDLVVITPKSTKSALNLVISNLSQAFGFLGGLQ